MVACIRFLFALTTMFGLSCSNAAQCIAAQDGECQDGADDSIDAHISLLQESLRLNLQSKAGNPPQLAELSPRTIQADSQERNEPKLAKKLVQASSKRNVQLNGSPKASPKGSAKASSLSSSGRRRSVQPTGGAIKSTTYRNWFQRMGDSMGDFIVSPFIMCLAISVMWLNERRNARMETLMSIGRQDVLEIKSSAANPNNRGCLVHIKDGKFHGVGTLRDDNFTTPDEKWVELSNIIKWRTVVQVYQWREQRHEKKEKDRVGGGETTTVWYTYHKEWSSSKHDSTRFHEKYGHENRFAAGSPYIKEKTVDRVEYGDGFLLPNELVSKLNEFEDASESFGKEGPLLACDEVIWGNLRFSKADKQELDTACALGSGDTEDLFMSLVSAQPTFHYYWREHVQTYRGEEPHIGDYRVAFRCVPDGPGTVLALQAESDDGQKSNRDTFLPYRVIERRWCGWTDDMEKKALLKEGRKSDEELEEQDRCCGGECVLCCCCCHLVNAMCSYIARPQIFTASQHEQSVSQCFSKLKRSNKLFTWLIRLVGWVLMNVALDMLLSPFTTFLDIIPLIGWLGNKAIGFVSGFVSLVITLLIVAAAYLIYHPSIGIPMLAGVVILISIPIVINAQLHKNK